MSYSYKPRTPSPLSHSYTAEEIEAAQILLSLRDAAMLSDQGTRDQAGYSSEETETAAEETGSEGDSESGQEQDAGESEKKVWKITVTKSSEYPARKKGHCGDGEGEGK